MDVKFYVTQITNTGDTDPTAIATFEKTDINEAKMLYHQIWASIYANPAVTHALVYIFTSDNPMPVLADVYDKPVEVVYGPVNEIDLEE